MFLSLAKTVTFLLLFFWLPVVVAQHPGSETGPSGTLVAKKKGNAAIELPGAILFCDRAVRTTTDQLNAYGHVLLVQGDSVVFRGDTLSYYPDQQRATLRGRVMFQDRRLILTTTRLDYDLPAGRVRYPHKSRVVEGDSVLIVQDGSYSTRSKQFSEGQTAWSADTGNPLRLEPSAIGQSIRSIPKADPASALAKPNNLARSGKREKTPKRWQFDRAVVAYIEVGPGLKPHKTDASPAVVVTANGATAAIAGRKAYPSKALQKPISRDISRRLLTPPPPVVRSRLPIRQKTDVVPASRATPPPG